MYRQQTSDGTCYSNENTVLMQSLDDDRKRYVPVKYNDPIETSAGGMKTEIGEPVIPNEDCEKLIDTLIDLPSQQSQ